MATECDQGFWVVAPLSSGSEKACCVSPRSQSCRMVVPKGLQRCEHKQVVSHLRCN